MKRKCMIGILILLLIPSIRTNAAPVVTPFDNKSVAAGISKINKVQLSEALSVEIEINNKDITLTAEEKPQEEVYSEAEVAIAKMMIAEAEGESEYGKRLVIDTILNWIDSPRFPNNVFDVLYQPGQFESITNGRFDNAIITEEDLQLVKAEEESRTSFDVLFFKAEEYHYFANPLFREGNHFFSN